jgi:hypothetical protein
MHDAVENTAFAFLTRPEGTFLAFGIPVFSADQYVGGFIYPIRPIESALYIKERCCAVFSLSEISL